MRNTPIDKIILEGPDLSGKTTLYNSIHKLTGNKWNIQDRSSLSMIVYAKLYGRNDYFHIEALKSELSNLNNIMILLLPEWSVVAKRFEKRGDEIQNLFSLKKVYELFKEAAEELENYPNVIVIKSEIDDDILDYIVHNLSTQFEAREFYNHSTMFMQAASCDKSLEKIGLHITHYDDGSFEDVSQEMLYYEKEKVYYNKLRKSIMSKISDELAGVNEYSRIETHESRRFVHTDNSCLSLLHFSLRSEFLYGEFYIRSSDTKETLKYDMNFIKALTRDVFSKLSEFSEIKMCKISLKIGSSHIINKQ